MQAVKPSKSHQPGKYPTHITSIGNTMPDPIISRERLEREARAAAKTYDNINDACPYPFGTDAARIFADEFKRARAVINAANYSNTNVPAAAKAATP